MRLLITLVGGAMLAALATAVLWPGSQPAPRPPGVTFTGEGDTTLQETVSSVIVRIRQRDAARLASLDVDLSTHHRGGPKSEAGARWLAEDFAVPLNEVVRVEVRHDQNATPLWHACLSYGSSGKKLLLDFNAYGKKNQWPDPHGGGKYTFAAHPYAELVGSAPQPGKQDADLFCEEGNVFATQG